MGCALWSKARRRPSQSCLSTGNDAYEFDAVAFSKWTLWPFVSMHGEAVVLHQNRLRRQLITLDKLGDGFRLASVHRFTVDCDLHARQRACSQSFQIGSSPW